MNRERFLTEYKYQLEVAQGNYPEEYSWPRTELDAVYGRMVAAFDRGSYNKGWSGVS